MTRAAELSVSPCTEASGLIPSRHHGMFRGSTQVEACERHRWSAVLLVRWRPPSTLPVVNQPNERASPRSISLSLFDATCTQHNDKVVSGDTSAAQKKGADSTVTLQSQSRGVKTFPLVHQKTDFMCFVSQQVSLYADDNLLVWSLLPSSTTTFMTQIILWGAKQAFTFHVY